MTVPGPEERRRVLLIFIDGVGIGRDDPSLNPVAAASLPAFSSVLGPRPLLADNPPTRTPAGLSGMVPIDAGMGVPGLPQSGTGQTAILTGVNTAELIGRHFGPWVPTGLRDLLSTGSLFTTAARLGASVVFANAYPAAGSERLEGARRPGAFPFAARASARLVYDEGAVRRGEALVSSITTESWRRYVDPGAPEITPGEAGARLSAIAAGHELTIFAHYDTDYVGHRGTFEEAVRAIERVDAFLEGSLAARSPDTLILITSDHGNLEDVSGGHTRNDVPFIAVGPGAGSALASVRSLTDISPLILETLGG